MAKLIDNDELELGHGKFERKHTANTTKSFWGHDDADSHNK